MREIMRGILILALILLPMHICLGETLPELRDEIEALGRWTQTYEAHGRTIEVDVPVIVPEVENFPIVQVSAQMGTEIAEQAGLQKAENQENAGAGIFYEDPGLLPYLDIRPTIGVKNKQLFRILIHTVLEGAAILFPHSHFSFIHFNAGFEMHDVCTQCSN